MWRNILRLEVQHSTNSTVLNPGFKLCTRNWRSVLLTSFIFRQFFEGTICMNCFLDVRLLSKSFDSGIVATASSQRINDASHGYWSKCFSIRKNSIIHIPQPALNIMPRFMEPHLLMSAKAVALCNWTMFSQHLGTMVGSIYINMGALVPTKIFGTVYECWSLAGVSSGLWHLHYGERIWAAKLLCRRSILQLETLYELNFVR